MLVDGEDVYPRAGSVLVQAILVAFLKDSLNKRKETVGPSVRSKMRSLAKGVKISTPFEELEVRDAAAFCLRLDDLIANVGCCHPLKLCLIVMYKGPQKCDCDTPGVHICGSQSGQIADYKKNRID